MKKIIELKQHFSYISIPQMERICKPLRHLEAPIFRYLRRYTDGSRSMLTNHPCFIEYFYEAGKYALEWSDGRDLTKLGNSVEIWETNILLNTPEQIEVTQHVSYEYKMRHGLVLIKPYKNFVEFFDFISDRKSIYQHDIALFQRFTYYFKQEADHLIRTSLQERISLPNIKSELPRKKQDSNVKDFLEETKIDTYFINPNETQMYLTSRELECMKQRLAGNSSKEIGRNLFISKKTVDRHFENLREKLKTIQRTRVIKTALELGLLEIM